MLPHKKCISKNTGKGSKRLIKLNATIQAQKQVQMEINPEGTKMNVN